MEENPTLNERHWLQKNTQLHFWLWFSATYEESVNVPAINIQFHKYQSISRYIDNNFSNNLFGDKLFKPFGMTLKKHSIQFDSVRLCSILFYSRLFSFIDKIITSSLSITPCPVCSTTGGRHSRRFATLKTVALGCGNRNAHVDVLMRRSLRRCMLSWKVSKQPHKESADWILHFIPINVV